MSPNVPCTSTTGWGCAADGLQPQSLAPGGETPGSRAACAVPAEASAATTATSIATHVLLTGGQVTPPRLRAAGARRLAQETALKPSATLDQFTVFHQASR